MGQVLVIDPDRDAGRIARDLEGGITDLAVDPFSIDRAHDVETIGQLPAGIDDIFGFLLREMPLVLVREGASRRPAFRAGIGCEESYSDESAISAFPVLSDQGAASLATILAGSLENNLGGCDGVPVQFSGRQPDTLHLRGKDVMDMLTFRTEEMHMRLHRWIVVHVIAEDEDRSYFSDLLEDIQRVVDGGEGKGGVTFLQVLVDGKGGRVALVADHVLDDGKPLRCELEALSPQLFNRMLE